MSEQIQNEGMNNISPERKDQIKTFLLNLLEREIGENKKFIDKKKLQKKAEGEMRPDTIARENALDREEREIQLARDAIKMLNVKE